MIEKVPFQLSVYVNKEIYNYWAPTIPQQLHQSPLQSQKLTLWCAVAFFGVIGLSLIETTKVHQLLWHLSANWICYAPSVNHSYITVKWIDLTTVSTGWSTCPYNVGISEHSVKYVSTACHFLWWWCSMNCTSTWSTSLWLLSLGVSQKYSFHL
jgi:hypothetical protein